MFKRVIWMGVGAAAGSVGTVWSQRKVKAQLDKLSEKATPSYAVSVAKSKVVDVRDAVTAAIEDGRATTRQTETEMRNVIEGRWGRGDRPA
jgi:3'-phosphoadenosine 5'-phosphosulfate sulfotransferase